MATVYSLICWGGSAGRSVTVSDTTDLVTLTNHGLRNSTGVAFTSGTLPTVTGTPLALNTIYYAKWIAANTFELYREAALTNKIDFTSTGSSLIMKSAYYLGLSDKSRWTTGGVERIYESLAAWISGRAGALATDEEVCEIGMAWTDVGTATRSVTVPSGRNTITTLVNGVRSAGWHGGDFGAGYIAAYNGGSFNGVALSRMGDVCDGFEVNQTNTGYAPSTGLLLATNTAARNMLVRSYSTQSTKGVGNTGSAPEIHNSVVTGFGIAYSQNAYQKFFRFYNCVAYGNGTGFAFNNAGGSNGNNAYVFNCVALGNTTNWMAGATDLWVATNNLGGTGEAWVKSPGIRFETTATAPFSSVFADAANLNLAPASVTSPLVENGTDYFGSILADIGDYLRPTYPGSAYNTAVTAGSFVAGLSYTIASVGTTDFTLIGASANTVGVTFKATGAGTGTGTATLNAKIDIGAYEFDLGYGTWPATATISLTDIVSGSRVLITKASDGSVLYNDVPGTSLSLSTSHIGDFNVVVRKASASPYYREFQASGTTVASQTTTIKCLQQLDE